MGNGNSGGRSRARRGNARRRIVVAITACLVLVGSLETPALAARRSELEKARAQYREVQGQLNRIAEQYAKQEERYDNLVLKIASTKRSIAKTSARADQLRERLRGRVRLAYRLGGAGFFDFLLSADSFREFHLRAVFLERQTSQDEDLMLKLGRLSAQLGTQQASLKSQERAKAGELNGLRSQAAQLDARYAEVGRLVKRYEDQERFYASVRTRSSGGSRASVGSSSSGRIVGLSRCPAAGPHAFSNDWGAPRGGGRRRHKGNDIFAPMGSPAVAVVPGRIKRHGSGGAGGLSVYLWGDDGNEYYYAHMSGFSAAVGARVGAGQTIAYVGNTGNARGGAPHIHFEIHPGGGGAINPYHSLIRVC